MKCPTCYQRIVAPQAPSSTDGNLVFTGHRYVERKTTNLPTTTSPSPATASQKSSPDEGGGKKMPVGIIVVVVLVLLAVAGGAYLFKSGTVTLPSTNSAKASLKHGAAGLGAWETAVEYDQLVITKGPKVLYKSNFAAGMKGWRPANGTWITQDGFLRQTATAIDCRALIGEDHWGDYTLSVRARKLSGKEGFLILFNVTDNDNWTWWNVGGWVNTKYGLETSVNGQKTALGSPVPGKLKTGEWYDLRVELSGLNVRCYLNNALIHDASYPPPNP
jgi:hypothetical protein